MRFKLPSEVRGETGRLERRLPGAPGKGAGPHGGGPV